LASERVWVDTHRFAAHTMVASGLVGFVLVVAFGWTIPAFVVMMAGALAPVLYSLVLYKRLERTGQI
jgi:heme/copper-type cytochrome/quinol oxidase subunit 4